MAARLTTYLVVAIVATTLIAGLIVGAQRDDSDGPVDLIVRNGRVFTADRRGTMAEAVAIRGNQILRVGTDREISRLQRPQTVIVDARGGAVLPGFNDARVSLIRGGLALQWVDLTGAADAAEMLARITAWRESNPAAGWIVGKGWSADQFKNGQPSRQLLDTAVPDRPVLLYGADDSSVWVNSTALRLAGITRKSQDPRDGTIVRDGRNGEPSGVLTGKAANMVASLVPAPARGEREQAILAAIAHANALGITSIQQTVDTPEVLDVYDAIRRSGDLTVRVYAAIPVDPNDVARSEADLEKYEAARKRFPDDPLLKSGALSIVLDGAVESGAAAMLEPLAAPAEPVAPRFDPDDLNRMVRLADAAGWHIITDAHGDRAVRMALNAYAHAVRSNRLPPRGRRHRVNGLTVVDRADANRFGPLGIVASVHPAASALRPARTESTLQPEIDRAPDGFGLATMAEETRLLLTSAWPVHALNPLSWIDAVVKRPQDSRQRADADSDRLDIKAAIDAYTSTPAWASFDDQRKGVIAPGMLADIVVLSGDIFAPGSERPAAVSVALTIFDGKVVYRGITRLETEPAPSLQH